ncbi:endoplasmic oxidoreductin-1 [Tilletia horrida]|nr:endoplasmic oxidoreductin-1 [Tilletia horrida]
MQDPQPVDTERRRRRTRSRWTSGLRIALLLSFLTFAACLVSASSPVLQSSLDPDPSLFLGIDSVLQKGANGQICRPTGLIDDARCDFETVEALNDEFFNSLHSLVQTPYFRYYKLDLFRECPFWNENGFCMNRACGVEQEDEHSIPAQYRSSSLSSVSSLDPNTNELLSSSDDTSNFCYWDDTLSSDAKYIDLVKNPERFTGYAGPSASRVWKSIYEENCFGLGSPFIEPPRSGDTSAFISRDTLLAAGSSSDNGGFTSSAFKGLLTSLEAPVDKGDSETCLEKRVFYRIISGLHASISIHVCADYLDQKTGEWAPNLECFVTRIAQHPERLQNVYFNYVLLLRALARLSGGWLDGIDIGTKTGANEHAPWNLSAIQEQGRRNTLVPPSIPPNLTSGDYNPEHASDSATREHLNALISAARASPPTFDEHSMFDPSNPETAQLRTEFRDRFRNISAIMDCVGCDKCRLWGKVQVQGLGTALKILFSESEAEQSAATTPGRSGASAPKPPALTRSELVALINTAHRFAESLRAVATFREMYQDALAERAREEEHKKQAKKACEPNATADGRIPIAHDEL